MIEIVWPRRMQVSAAMMEEWFAAAAAQSLLAPEQLSARTPQAMAEVLESIGWLVLQSKQFCDITDTEG
jgi:hypothetical protein